MLNRRIFTLAGLSTLGVALGTTLQTAPLSYAQQKGDTMTANIDWKALNKSDWQTRLEAAEFHVLRKAGTERPFSSPLNDEKRDGIFVCAGCALPLFTATAKYESGTGWPSFFQPIKGNVETKRDFKMVVPRTEYHCKRCGGHQGHVFKDGPAPTGLRFCNNGVALDFIPS